MRHHHVTAAAVLVLTVLVPCAATACGFIESVARLATLREQAAPAKLIVYGTLANPRKAADGSGSTDFTVISVIKSYPGFNKKMLTLPRYLTNNDSKQPPHFLLFFRQDHRGSEPYDGVGAGPGTGDYVTGLLALAGNDRHKVLRYCLDFLDSPDPVVACDALLEFMKTTDQELGVAARRLPAEKLRVWIKDATTPGERLRMYGFLLGNCGGDGDAAILRARLEKEAAEPRPSLFDGALTGYVLLRPKEGWSYLRQLMGTPANGFTVRYSALRAARFFFNTRDDVISKTDVVDALKLTLDQPDMADLSIESLRTWRRWDLADRVLSLYGKPLHDARIIRSAVLRYALQCPGPEAARVVAAARLDDPEMVTDFEEIMKLESVSPPAVAP